MYLIDVSLREDLRHTDGVELVELDKVVTDVQVLLAALQQEPQNLDKHKHASVV